MSRKFIISYLTTIFALIYFHNFIIDNQTTTKKNTHTIWNNNKKENINKIRECEMKRTRSSPEIPIQRILLVNFDKQLNARWNQCEDNENMKTRIEECKQKQKCWIIGTKTRRRKTHLALTTFREKKTQKKLSFFRLDSLFVSLRRFFVSFLMK